jgi:hypothetical protein
MNIYALKNKIKRLKAANDPKHRYWLMFLQDLYNKELQNIANKVTNDLSQEQKEKKSWANYLAN